MLICEKFPLSEILRGILNNNFYCKRQLRELRSFNRGSLNSYDGYQQIVYNTYRRVTVRALETLQQT